MPLPTKIIEAPLRLLAEYKVDCVIVGGVAAAIHGSMRLTNDVDVCYARDSSNLKRLEIRGVGIYDDVLEGSVTFDLFGHSFAVIDIGKLIVAKRVAGRTKDLLVLPELEAIQEAQAMTSKAEPEEE
jgi:hypothetical protein